MLLLLASLQAGTPQQSPALAQEPEPPDNPLRTSSDTLDVSIVFGERQQVPLTITNDGPETFAPHLYEAHPVPPEGVVPQRALPSHLQRVALPQQDERIDPQIAADIAAEADGKAEFLVFLNDQPDLSAAYAIDDWGARGRYVYTVLSRHAERTQRDLRAWLDGQGLDYYPLWIVNALVVEGSEADVAALAARAEVALLRANHITSLQVGAAMPARSWLPAPLQQTEAPDTDLSDVPTEWNIKQIQANRAWQDFGVTGQGITLSHIDSGVQYDHPALLRQYRGYQGGEENAAEHTYNWYDPIRGAAEPLDENGHGTHVLGIMTGRGDGTIAQTVIGVAPGATWIAARGCEVRSCSEAALMAAAQWILAPTDSNGEHPRPDLRPHIVNNSWGGVADDDYFLSYTTAWRAAGIFPVFVSGNNGSSECSTVGAPGEYSNVIAVGSTNFEDKISLFSGTGPSVSGSLKPDLTAPGQNIRSAYADFPYTALSGTSMAAPHVAGAVALLWSANPTLIGDYDTTYAILTSTAMPITDDDFSGSGFANCHADSVPNNIYGHGRLDAYAAVAKARVDIPWLELPNDVPQIAAEATRTLSLTLDTQHVAGPGSYQARVLVGTGDLSQSPQEVTINLTVLDAPAAGIIRGEVRSQESDSPLTGSILVDDKLSIDLEQDGTFAITRPVRSEAYTLRTNVSGYVQQSTEVTFTTAISHALLFDLVKDIPRFNVGPTATIQLADLTPITATLEFGEEQRYTLTVRNTGSQPLTYKAIVPLERYGVWRSDEANPPNTGWIALPGYAETLELADDGSSEALPLGFRFPFNDTVVEEVYVASNGMLSFEALPEERAFRAGCLPAPETLTSVLAPLRLDLDPAQGGRVRWAQVEAGFVVAYENVPLHSDDPTSAPRYTFQVLLAQDGRIVYSYARLDEISSSVAVGVQWDIWETQSLGCGEETPISAGLSIELRPQPDAQQWMSVAGTVEGELLPDQQSSVTVIMRGSVAGFSPRPYRSAVVFDNNDPRQTEVRLPVEVVIQPAPHAVLLPLVMNAPDE